LILVRGTVEARGKIGGGREQIRGSEMSVRRRREW
jgi:hypothetical protein